MREVFRIIDANKNRTLEGLRVIEDLLRFVVSDYPATLFFKNTRHKITSIFKNNLYKNLISCRDSINDVGRGITLKGEKKRDNLYGVLKANFQRVKESIRVLEECTKLIDVTSSGMLKKIRFDIYIREKYILSKIYKKVDFSLYAIIDTAFVKKKSLVNVIENIIRGGATVIQLRDKTSNTKDFICTAKKIRKITESKNIPFIVNDRVDIAYLVDADGVHIGQEDMSVREARMILGINKIIGVSTNDVTEAKKAFSNGADYIACGPVFPTATKYNTRDIVSKKSLKNICSVVNCPVVAIGGINSDNIEELKNLGLNGIAVISAILKSNNVRLAVRSLKKKLCERDGVLN